ncbi:DNA polymerase I [Fructilactobacillus sanfranciscensis]|uniref:DNA polymerase I n=1 Tax=Fructilactobacillus sanfranciscensis TaxID=1625 RepID=UPI000CD42C7A|nr:DNA polymerase I [Fructilactobacillus sanfranciscensis]NDR60040.1 DNA polymerase I [Fructilactobacillus sanfranciscensis]NDR69451.1 DNA polymerase I [Fructilactobacillus sanfranciscensis]NDS16059.1 DNA polymerase I [Fructilactobacillus sanfranciscensis]POH21006.1 DNA polymerase I [Fructilactobacillus sanfranciscensis]TNK98015.1 DNA polymerase I [Fructilactobacillus sanfranciscensis]
MTEKKLLLIDGNSLTYKAFFALYTSMDRFTSPDGLHTSAVYGFNRMLNDILADIKPTTVLAAFDAGKKTFRTKMYSDYKAGRAKMPDELREQFPYVMDLLKARGIKTYELKDYEADDIIGTTAKIAEKEGYHVDIITGDRDLTQLCSEKTTVKVSKKGVSDLEDYTPTYVKKNMGINPEQIIDIKGLQGDTSDNYPGVEKVGPKTAIKLIKQYGTVQGLYDHIDEITAKKLKEHLVNDEKQAFLSKKLATIDTNAPIDIKLADLIYKGPQEPELSDFYKKMGFKSFLNSSNNADNQLGTSKIELPEVEFTELSKENLDEVNSLGNEITFNLETINPNYHTAEQLGFVIGNEKKWFVSRDMSLLSDKRIKQILENSEINKNIFDTKAQIVGLHRNEIGFQGVDFDMLLVSYLINTLNNEDDIGEVANRHGYFGVLSDEEVYGKGKSLQIPDNHELFEHMVRKALAISTLKKQMLEKLKEHQQADLYRDLELPLARVLSAMEIQGISVNQDKLEELKSKFTERVSEYKQKIYQEAGEEFNIGSPKQLGIVLFEKMGLPVIKKTKTGYSTAVDVLEQLAPDHPIIENILNYRQLTKLISTYLDGIKADITDDGKVHTRYLQTLTQTGRLSSVDPNLQNIPVRTEEGRKVREAFVPSHKGWKLFSSDYSQIELRVLAAISGDKNMREAFESGEDIHAATARRIFELDKDAVITPTLRRQAKAVNFGIVYGISSFGLAHNTGISNGDAKRFIDKYFNEYPGVKQYMEDSVKFAKEHGYVETISHRRRYIPEIQSKRFQQRQFAERIAMNSPIQGSAADIIKAAMIEMQSVLKEKGLQAKILLQIHDELIFEAPETEIPVLEKLVPQVMDSIMKTDKLLSNSTVDFNVPLKVESHSGSDWYNIKK